MDNQHKKIKGYRDLSQSEIDLMNKIKAHAEGTLSLIRELRSLGRDEITTEQLQESARCVEIAQEQLQTGQMWLVRAVALPESF